MTRTSYIRSLKNNYNAHKKNGMKPGYRGMAIIPNYKQKMEAYDAYEYDAVICEQLENGIVEVVPEEIVGKEFYIPHKAVISVLFMCQ